MTSWSRIDECHIQITVSMGYYILGQTEAEAEALDSAQEIVKRADEALYWVKRNGRNGALSWEDLMRLDTPPSTQPRGTPKGAGR